MNALFISDLHLTANARDEYRWELFEWLIEQCPLLGVKELYILGDLTDAKDYHSAKLVNRVVRKLTEVRHAAQLLEIIILRGNHDGLDPDCAYFKFLGKIPYITYHDHPYQKQIGGQEVLFLPHTVDPVKAWDAVDMHGAEVILMHATITGSLAENGQALQGIPASLLATARRAKILSGDVHVPQQLGRITYVGAPYPVRFGDKFTGRALLTKNWHTFESVPIPSIQRMKVQATVDGMPRGYANLLRPKDQVKVELLLQPSEFGEWDRVKRQIIQECARRDIVLCGLELARQPAKPLPKLRPRGAGAVRKTPQQVLADYCAANKVPQALLTEGESILASARED